MPNTENTHEIKYSTSKISTIISNINNFILNRISSSDSSQRYSVQGGAAATSISTISDLADFDAGQLATAANWKIVTKKLNELKNDPYFKKLNFSNFNFFTNVKTGVRVNAEDVQKDINNINDIMNTMKCRNLASDVNGNGQTAACLYGTTACQNGCSQVNAGGKKSNGTCSKGTNSITLTLGLIKPSGTETLDQYICEHGTHTNGTNSNGTKSNYSNTGTNTNAITCQNLNTDAPCAANKYSYTIFSTTTSNSNTSNSDGVTK